MTASSTRWVTAARRRLVSGTLSASMVPSGPATDRHLVHLLLNIIVGRPIVRIRVVGGWEVSVVVVRGDRFIGARQCAPGTVGRDRFGTRQCASRTVGRNRWLVAR